jgi:acetoin utilization protein AcuB
MDWPGTALALEADVRITPYIQQAVVTVKPLDSALHARELLERHRINQLPVVVDGRVVGIVTDRDLRDVFPSTLEPVRRRPRHPVVDPDRVRVRDVMSQPVFSLGTDDSLKEAAGLLRRQRIGAVPILDEKSRLCGILTRSDLLRALAENVDPHDL